MTVTTFKPETYRDCPIYYRTFKDHFEYLLIINNELYTTHITVVPNIITKLFYVLSIEALPYSKELLPKILAELRKMAETTIDSVLDSKENTAG